MYKFIYLVFIVFLSMGLTACSETESNEGEMQDTSVTETTSERERTPQVDELGSANELINLMVGNLEERLSLSDQDRVAIKNVYQNAYLKSGGSLDEPIDRGGAKEIRQQIIRDSKSEVLRILDEDQRTFYERFLANQ
jgi:hypothetical protein